MSRKIVLVVSLLIAVFCRVIEAHETDDGESFRYRFAFLTDVHMNGNNVKASSAGLKKALEHAKQQGAEFVIFGGDLIDLDHLKEQDQAHADTMVGLFLSIVSESGLKAHFAIGNHDRYYTFEGNPDPSGFAFFEKHYGETYFSFDHKGIHFVVLNSVQIDPSTSKYCVGPAQVEWLKNDLSQISPETPLVVVTHVPFQSLYYPAVEGVVKDLDMFMNFKEVWDILSQHNLKVILQGHQHLHEELLVNKTHFVTGGAVSAAWWGGPLLDTEEGYLLVEVKENGHMNWQYIDYDWEAAHTE